MKYLLSICLLISSIISYSQDTIYLDNKSNPVEKNQAEIYQIKFTGTKIKDRIVEETFFLTGEKKSVACYYYDPSGKTSDLISDGIQKTWYRNGKLKSSILTSKGRYNDTLSTYWENGILKRKDIFKEGKFIKGKCYDQSGLEIKHTDYEITPQYPGGDKNLLSTIAKNLEMPQFIRDKGLRISVIVRFEVDENGNITDISMYKRFNNEVDAEAMRVVRLLKPFKPALLDGEPFKCKFFLPLTFAVTN